MKQSDILVISLIKFQPLNNNLVPKSRLAFYFLDLFDLSPNIWRLFSKIVINVNDLFQVVHVPQDVLQRDVLEQEGVIESEESVPDAADMAADRVRLQLKKMANSKTRNKRRQKRLAEWKNQSNNSPEEYNITIRLNSNLKAQL